jgi:hypothetical protein
MSNSWYVVTLILKCMIEGQSQRPITCFEQIHLIEAGEDTYAYDKALRLGKSQEHSYNNDEGKTISWEFVGIQNLEEILDETIHDGIEIRNRRLLVDDPLTLVRDKDGLTVFISENIRNQTAEEILSKTVDDDDLATQAE